MTDAELAAELAADAGRFLVRYRRTSDLEGDALGRAGDREANVRILAGLARHRPGDPVLSEESPDRDPRLGAERVWIIDPLDGSREYGQGRDDWAVHIALAIGGVPAIGAVAVPQRGMLLRSDLPPDRVPPRRERPLMLVSRTRPPALTAELAALIGADIRQMGSAGAKAAAVIQGDADLYVHAGGQHEWDNCAPAAVALGAGLHASRVDGSALVYNRPDTMVPDLVIGDPDLAAVLVDHVRRKFRSASQD